MKLIFAFTLALFFLNQTQASRALIKSHQSFYHSDSLISHLLIPTLTDVDQDQLLIESGLTNTLSSNRAASFVGHKMVSEKWLVLLALGEQNDLVGGARTRFNSDNNQFFMLMQNPVHLFVTYKFWGQSLVLGTSYSNYRNKKGLDYEKSTTTSIGYRYGLLHLNFHWTAVDQSIHNNGDELTLEQPMQFVGLYQLDSAELAIKYDSYFQKFKIGGVESTSEDQQIVQISYYDDTKIQDIQFNYRIEYNSRTNKNKLTNTVNRVNSFPVTLGFDHRISPWLKLISSVKQPLFINQGTGPLHTANSTSVNVGAQFTYEKVRVDGVLNGLSTSQTGSQTIDGNSLLTQVSLTYTY